MIWTIIAQSLFFVFPQKYLKEQSILNYVFFLEKNKLLSPYQCGFRKWYSTELATISLSDSILRSMDQGMLTGSVFIDLKKAFDTMDHDL